MVSIYQGQSIWIGLHDQLFEWISDSYLFVVFLSVIYGPLREKTDHSDMHMKSQFDVTILPLVNFNTVHVCSHVYFVF